MSQDLTLMRRIHAGDASALDELLQRYWTPLVAYAARLLSDADAAEDVVQDVMLRVWSRREEWTPSGRLQGFLYQITRNLALNERERRQVRRKWKESEGRDSFPANPPGLDPAERAELRQVLDGAVEDLPPKRREVFVLARYHGHSYREIAEIMGTSAQTVANQMSAALDQLRDELRPQIDEFLGDGGGDGA